jgi:hypothetical protein
MRDPRDADGPCGTLSADEPTGAALPPNVSPQTAEPDDTERGSLSFAHRATAIRPPHVCGPYRPVLPTACHDHTPGGEPSRRRLRRHQSRWCIPECVYHQAVHPLRCWAGRAAQANEQVAGEMAAFGRAVAPRFGDEGVRAKLRTARGRQRSSRNWPRGIWALIVLSLRWCRSATAS